jgi:uncharacterized coiled-coil protein SlyX
MVPVINQNLGFLMLEESKKLVRDELVFDDCIKNVANKKKGKKKKKKDKLTTDSVVIDKPLSVKEKFNFLFEENKKMKDMMKDLSNKSDILIYENKKTQEQITNFEEQLSQQHQVVSVLFASHLSLMEVMQRKLIHLQRDQIKALLDPLNASSQSSFDFLKGIINQPGGDLVAQLSAAAAKASPPLACSFTEARRVRHWLPE